MDSMWLLPIVTAALSFIGGLAGAYFRAYSTRKGENLATKEDIGELTTITKKIESEISDAAWNRQKRWELRREVAIEALKRLAELDEALLGLNTGVKAELAATGDPGKTASLAKALASYSDRYGRAARRFHETTLLMDIVCTHETQKAFNQFLAVANRIMTGITKDKNAEVYEQSQQDLKNSIDAANAALRKELGIDNVPKTQKSG
jgi:hypothetical protein